MAKVNVFTFVRCFVCLSFCLSVCLSATLEKTEWWTDFHENFRLFSNLSGESASVSNIMEKTGEQIFYEIFTTVWIWHKQQSRTFWWCCINLFRSRIDFGIFCIRAWYQCYGKTGERILMNFLGYVGHGTTKHLARLFHAWLDCSIVSVPSAASHLLATLR